MVFDGPQGRGFFKGGHNESTGNTWVCVLEGRRCVLILANDVRAEGAFPAIVAALLGETGAPWRWEYGEMAFWNAGAAPTDGDGENPASASALTRNGFVQPADSVGRYVG